MRRNRGGFTILEVMIFLAISGVMLAAAMVTVNGQQHRTEFTEGMRDIDAKLQDTLNDVSTGNFSYNGKDCKAVGPLGSERAQLTGPSGPPPAGTEIGTRLNCLFLGDALQFNTQSTKNNRFVTYTVLGRRIMTDSIGSKVPVQSFDLANPTAMMVGGQKLSSSYTFQNGITLKSINYPSGTGIGNPKAALLGIYTSFNSVEGPGGSSADASQALQVFVYGLSNTTDFDNATAKNCVDDNNPTGPCPRNVLSTAGGGSSWSACFDSNNGTGQTGLITIFNTAAGVNTKLEFNPDSALC